jgi:hypothetical protein
MTSSNKLERDELLEEIDRLADEIGTTPTTSEMNEHGEYSIAPYYRVFGSWTAALQAAGFDPPTVPKERSTSELLAEIRRLADGSDPPSQAEMDTDGAYAPETYRSRFGSWTAALREAGFTPPTHGDRISDADLLDALTDLADRIESVPTSADMNEDGPYSAATYINRFGSWRDALVAAGLNPDDMTYPTTTEMLIDGVQELAAELDRPPAGSDMNKLGPYHTSTYYRRFGSWSAALEKAGIEPQSESTSPDNKLDRDTLLSELHRLATIQDGESPPTTTMMEEHGEYSPGTYINRFGSWASALSEAGIDN